MRYRHLGTALLLACPALITHAQTQDIASPRERAGAIIFGERCSVCHGARLAKADASYDLTHAASWSESDFVRASKTARGSMPSFATLLSDAQLADVWAYVRRGHTRDLDNVPMESGH